MLLILAQILIEHLYPPNKFNHLLDHLIEILFSSQQKNIGHLLLYKGDHRSLPPPIPQKRNLYPHLQL